MNCDDSKLICKEKSMNAKMSAGEINTKNRKDAYHFLKIFTPMLIVLAVVLWIFYQRDVTSIRVSTGLDNQQVIQLAKQSIIDEESMLHGDALYLAGHSSLHRWLDTGSNIARSALAHDMLNFVRQREIYDQVRFIDKNGLEIVRINWNKGQPEIVSANKLQNKANRYYVRDSLSLAKGEIYISPFDLNVENKKIEQPIKPMIRLATPVFDHAGHKRGIIILNYLGQHMLDRLRQLRKQNRGELWLLNSDGYWLLGPNTDEEWGFMYPSRKLNRFNLKYENAWKAIQSGGKTSQLIQQNGLFTYSKLNTDKIAKSIVQHNWILVSFLSKEKLNTMLSSTRKNLLVVFMTLGLMLYIISNIASYYALRRKDSETRVRENEVRYRGLLNSAPDAIVTMDQNGLITLVNSQTEKYFGYNRKELIGKPIEVLVPQRFHEAHHHKRENYVTAPYLRPMNVEHELFGLRKDGSEFPAEISLSPLQTDEGLLVTSIIRDITSRKQAELARRMVETRYQELITNLPVGVYRNTPGVNGHFLEVNPAMVTIFEADSIEQLLEHSVSELYCDPDERKKFSDKLMQQGYVKSEEVHLKTLKGHIFFAAITAVMKQSKDEGAYFSGIIEDVTERKISELEIIELNKSLQNRSVELEAINQELESFSYSVSHDLRAPLRAIDGFSQMLVSNYSDQLDDKGKDRLNRVRAGAQRMGMLIDDLIKLSRLSRTEILRESVDMTQIAKNVLEELHDGESQRKVEAIVQPDLVDQADSRFVRVIMDNLLGNAWKFTRQNDNARIEAGAKDGDKGMIYFVRDNGAGFDMEYASKLFGAFQRLHDSSEFPGTGIGLATVQRAINKHGGSIWAESKVGEGTTFYFTLKQGVA